MLDSVMSRIPHVPVSLISRASVQFELDRVGRFEYQRIAELIDQQCVLVQRIFALAYLRR